MVVPIRRLFTMPQHREPMVLPAPLLCHQPKYMSMPLTCASTTLPSSVSIECLERDQKGCCEAGASAILACCGIHRVCLFVEQGTDKAQHRIICLPFCLRGGGKRVGALIVCLPCNFLAWWANPRFVTNLPIVTAGKSVCVE